MEMEMRINMKMSCFLCCCMEYHVAQTSLSSYTYNADPSYVIELDLKHHKSEEAEDQMSMSRTETEIGIENEREIVIIVGKNKAKPTRSAFWL